MTWRNHPRSCACRLTGPDAAGAVRGDAGASLVELVVAMTVFGVLSSIVVAGVVAMNGGALRITSASDDQAGIWQAYTTLDRQVRYADAVNLPGLAAGSAWVEYRTTSPSDPVPRCYQWRYTPTTGDLSTRSWTPGSAPTSSSWTTVLTTQPAASGTQPFTTTQTTTSRPKEMLTVNLAVTTDANGGGSSAASPVSESSPTLVTTFVARNSSPASLGNLDVDHDGASDTPVCAEPGYRS